MAITGNPQVEEINSRGVEPVSIPDPGDALTFDVSRPGYIDITTAAAETRTLADPVFIGQILDLFFIVDAGDVTITASSPVNQAGNTSIVGADVGDHIRFVGHYNATDGWEWRVVANDGFALS